jgi:hypothetical protein
MPSAPHTEPREWLRRALAGLQAGVLGSLAMLLFLMLGSVWTGRSVWKVPNLFATAFAGPDAYRNQYTRTTLGGIALIVVIYGLLGVCWGLLAGDRQPKWLTFAALAAGFLVYEIFFGIIWNQTRPLITLYAPDRQLMAAHLVWGLLLARSVPYLHALRFGSESRYDAEEIIRVGATKYSA